MKVNTKRTRSAVFLWLAVALLCTVLFAVTLSAPSASASADTESNIGLTYYYRQLKNSPMAQRFYQAMQDMDEKGYLSEGNLEYDLKDVVTQTELGQYANGSPQIPVALGAARDAFYLDHPDLFYADVHKLVLTVGTTADGKYAAYLGRGRAENYYDENTVKDKADALAKVAEYNAAVNAIVNEAEKQNGVAEQIRYVNKEIATAVKYSYDAYEVRHGNDTIIEYDGFVHTAYSLVSKKALCDGYSTAFKAVMDRLNIPCVLIIGSACDNTPVVIDGETVRSGYESHAWNAVRVDGLWYAVDVTWNATTGKPDKYTLVGSDYLLQTHLENPVISSSGFEVKYPALRPLAYGVNTDDTGFEFKDSGVLDGKEFGYASVGNDADASLLYLGVSYQGENCLQLRERGLYVLMRTDSDTQWVSYAAISDFWEQNTDEPMVVGKYSYVMVTSAVHSLQFAVTAVAPDCNVENFMGDIPLPNGGYTDLTDKDLIAVSAKYGNESYGTLTLPPFVKAITPNEKGAIQNFEGNDITLTYDEQLVLEDESAPVGIKVTADGFEDIENYVKISNVAWNASTNTVSFRFVPSQPYNHNGIAYYFTPTNLIGEKSRLAPTSGRLRYQREPIVCPKVYNDGRLYMKIFGTPTFVSASDESTNGFKDKNGQPIVGDQRSQLMLVVNKPTKQEDDDMMQAAKDEFNLNNADIKASATYEINLQLCALIRQVPEGSYMQVGFGFPEGFGPEDAGVTFTVYHYKRDKDGKIIDVDEVPCVVTEYGITATVQSFSPFMICAVDSTKVQSSGKKIMASVDGVGGKVDDMQVVTVKENESITYAITPESGYMIDSVRVNGTERKADLNNGKLTLTHKELSANNTVVVTFIAYEVANADTQKGFVRITPPQIIAKQSDIIIAANPESSIAPAPDPKTGLIIGLTVPILLLLIGGGIALFFVLRKNEQKQATATAGASPSTAAPAAKQTTATTAKSTAATAAKPTTTTTAARSTTNTAARPSTTTTRPATSATTRPSTTTTTRPTTSATTRPSTTTTARPTTTTTARPTTATPAARPSTTSTTKPNTPPTKK